MCCHGPTVGYASNCSFTQSTSPTRVPEVSIRSKNLCLWKITANLTPPDNFLGSLNPWVGSTPNQTSHPNSHPKMLRPTQRSWPTTPCGMVRRRSSSLAGDWGLILVWSRQSMLLWFFQSNMGCGLYFNPLWMLCNSYPTISCYLKIFTFFSTEISSVI